MRSCSTLAHYDWHPCKKGTFGHGDRQKQREDDSGEDPGLPPSEDAWPCQHLDLRLLLSRTNCETNICFFFSTIQFMVPCYINSRYTWLSTRSPVTFLMSSYLSSIILILVHSNWNSFVRIAHSYIETILNLWRCIPQAYARFFLSVDITVFSYFLRNVYFIYAEKLD